MIIFEKYKLDNGLTVILKEDKTTAMAAVNVLYKVGARDENPQSTGFAHLFEHLMFEGSLHIPSYDTPLQNAGGINNAFTNNDYTNYYLTVPAANLETGLWLESDRMLSLAFFEEKLDIQKKVVIEEFKERYLNKPYGDLWLEFRPLCYKVHPYQWPTIGEKTEHIADATLDQVKDFFEKYYHPANAILAVTGNINIEETKALIHRWFGDIPSKPEVQKNIPKEPQQTEERRKILERDVPQNMIMMGYPMSNRLSEDYYVADIFSEIAGNGNTSRIYQLLVKEKKIFSDAGAFILGSIDEGLVCFYGRMNDDISQETAEAEIKKLISNFQDTLVSDTELNTAKNRYELVERLDRMGFLNNAMQLCYFEMLGDANMINTQFEQYNNITALKIKDWCLQTFRDNKCNILFYQKNSNHE